MKHFTVALLGFGSVGKQLALYLVNEQKTLESRTDCKMTLKKILTRTPHKVTNAGLDDTILAASWQSILDDPEIDCVIELVGGTTTAKDFITDSLNAGKHVITANKAVLAEHGPELWGLARKNNLCIAFEASCGGGIPIIRALTDGLIANKISAILGVLNGTCNFILTEMEKKKISFDAALEKANSLGMVEADPSLDIEGIDAAHKIAIMAGLAYNTKIDFHALSCKGINEVQTEDIQFGKKLGYKLKLLAMAKEDNEKVSVWVHPAFLIENHPLSAVEGPFNAISVLGHIVGHSMYLGRGAGGKATSSAVIADAVSIANESHEKIFASNVIWPDKNSKDLQASMDVFVAPAYIRLFVKDEIGMLATISRILAKNGISIARALQEDRPQSDRESAYESGHQSDRQSDRAPGSTSLIVITHEIQWSSIKKAKAEIDLLKELRSPSVIYPIIKEIEDSHCI